jgi:hypothetical protein
MDFHEIAGDFAANMKTAEDAYIVELQAQWEEAAKEARQALEKLNKTALPKLWFDTERMVFITRMGQFPESVQQLASYLETDFFPILEPWIKQLGSRVSI